MSFIIKTLTRVNLQMGLENSVIIYNIADTNTYKKTAHTELCVDKQFNFIKIFLFLFFLVQRHINALRNFVQLITL